MTYHALVPVKKLTHAKSRLTNEMPLKERTDLVLSMLEHVINVLKTCREISTISIVTSDEDVRSFSLQLGVSVQTEESTGHNPALTAAAKKETNATIKGLLTISADLPLLTHFDIQKMIDLSKLYDVVIAPSKDNGTNALLLKKPLLLPYLFGKNSFEKYEKAAKDVGIPFISHQSETLAFDIDTIEDVKKLKTLK